MSWLEPRGAWRDRLLLGLIAFCVWSVLMLGIGIAIGRSQRKGASAPSQGGSAPAASYLTVKALVQGYDGEKNQVVADKAVRFLKQRYGERHDVFKLTHGRDLWVCVGRFQPGSRAEAEKLAQEISGLSFKIDASSSRRLRGAELAAVKE